MKPPVIPVVLSGGSGTRLWPRSRKHYPKQLLKLSGPNSMLQETILRIEQFAPPIIVSSEDHRFLVAEQLQEIDCTPASIILEPLAKNTAPAITLAALESLKSADDAILVILPADHMIADDGNFIDVVTKAVACAEADNLVTFGVVPTAPETGYGYIKSAAGIEEGNAVSIKEFVEKPDLQLAEQYLASGDYFWNSGMFVFKASAYLQAIEENNPPMLAACKAAYEKAVVDLDFIRVDGEEFALCPEDSIDYAVMEKANNAYVVPLASSWSDLGSWSSLWEAMTKDDAGNVSEGDILLEDCKDSLFYSDQRLIAAIDVQNLIVVDTKDAVLIANKDSSQNVKSIVSRLNAEKRAEHLLHREVHRPWGSYDSVQSGKRYQVKKISVKPGASLSLQMHHHRAEHWIVVKGTALVQRGEEELLVAENESIYIPLGEKHRLTNPGCVALDLIEVQSGSYLGEDDIVRFDDVYGRPSG